MTDETPHTADEPMRLRMRAPCPRCGCEDGILTALGGQDTVRCAAQNHYCYNAPRIETGRERRSLRTRPEIRPSQRSRVFSRDNFTCIMCHRNDLPLEVGHLVSVHDGHLAGLSDADLASDLNLATMCAPCNSGQGRRSLPPHLLAAVILARKQEGSGDGGRRPA